MQLYHDLDEPQFDFMRRSFAEFLTARLKSQFEPPQAKVLSAFSETDECISIAAARRLLKITHRAMADLIAAVEISFVIGNQGTTLKFLVSLSDVERVKRKFEQSLTTRELARDLAVNCEMFENCMNRTAKTRW